MEDPHIGQVFLGRYDVTRVIGRGGMSTVYRGEQKLGGITRPVAIKVLDRRSTNDPNLVERFKRESETIVRLRHPNTVEIYDVGELPDGTMFFVMEYIEGESLSALIRRGPLEADRIDKVLLQICGSLHDAHELGVIHRDLKPANVLMTNRGMQTDFVKVLDFGLAKTDWDGEQLTGHDRLLGTPAYMSPEQFMNGDLDSRSDIYSLGVLTYQMVTGKLPFYAKSPWDWASRHMAETPPPIGTLPTGKVLHPRKEAAIMRALSKKQKHRQSSVLEFLREYTGFKDVGQAWAQSTSGSGARPESSIAPPSGGPGFTVGTLDIPGKVGPPPPPVGLLQPRPSMGAQAAGGKPRVPPPPPARVSLPAAHGMAANTDPQRDVMAIGREVAGLGGPGAAHTPSLHPGHVAASTSRRGGHEDIAWGPTEGLAPIGVEDVRRRGSARPIPTEKATSQTWMRVLQIGGVLFILAAAVVAANFIRRQTQGEAAMPPEEVAAPANTATPGEADLDKARIALRAGDIDSAVTAVEAALHGGEPPEGMLAAVRAELSPAAGGEVAHLVKSGRCEDAQRLYMRLVTVGAEQGSRERFTSRCTRP